MHSRALRILLVIACICGIAATAVFIRSLEHTLTVRRAELRDFDRLAREATDALADVRAAQQAYVAFGQGTGFWTAKVDTTMLRVMGVLATLQPLAASATSKSVIDQAVAAVTEFSKVDTRIREYLETGEQLMAADIVFTEGGEAAVAARQHVEQARLEEHVAFDRFEADNRKLEAAAAGSTGIVLFVTAILALVPLKRTVEAEKASTSFNLTAASEPLPAGSAPSSSSYDLPLADGDRPELNPRDVAAPAAELPEHATAAALQSVAQLCTDIGRVGDPEELAGLFSRAADVLDASGLILWVATASGSELQPALAHGYSPEMVSRIPMVPRSANNAAAAAYRSGTLQIVLSQAGSHLKGAVVAPVLSADGCVGVLSAEIRNSGEASATVQSLATIFAAQLAGVVASTAGAPEQRATGSGAVAAVSTPGSRSA